MNDFLDNLGKVMNETAKKAIKASGDVLELTKTSLNIKFDEAKRDSMLKEIGKLVYNTYKDSPDSITDDILEFCKCIDEIEESISTQKVKVAGLQNKKYCCDCGLVICKTVNYCHSCGAKQPEIPKDECCCGCEDEDPCDCGCQDGEPCDCGDDGDDSADSCCCDGDSCSFGDNDSEDDEA